MKLHDKRALMFDKHTSVIAAAGNGHIAFNGARNVPLKSAIFYGKCEQRLLPSEYQQVEYIESHGQEYIDTQVYGKPTDIIEVKFWMKDYKSVIGYDDSTNSINITGTNYGVGYRYNSVQFHHLDFNKITTAKFEGNKLYIDGILVNEYSKPAVEQKTISMCLFARKTDQNVAEDLFYGRIYYCKITQDEQLIRNFVPCYRKSDNEIGMYDTVNNVFYTNQGEGAFTKGNDVYAPSPEMPHPIYSNNSKWELNNGAVDLSTIILNGIGDAKDTYDSQTGLLTRKIGVVDLGTLEFEYDTANELFYALIGNKASSANLLCRIYRSVAAPLSNMRNYTMQGTTGGTVLYIKNTDYATAADFKSAMSGVFLYYELETPAAEYISPQSITQIKGENILRQISGEISDTAAQIEYYGRV